MKEKKVHTLFIDTKIDKNQNPSKFKVKLNNWFLRNTIKNNETSKNDWFISVKSIAMFNSFSNITTGVNDKILLFIAKDLSTTTVPVNESDPLYTIEQFSIPEGNPNVVDIQNRLNAWLKDFDLECKYDSYDSKFEFENILNLGDRKLKFFSFKNSYDILGFVENRYYKLNNDTHKIFRSNINVNMMADRLVKFSIGANSDFTLKNMNYCNHINNQLFNECNMFHLQPVNVNPYDLIYYERSTENLIPIELYKNNITYFEIQMTNQDNDNIEGIGDYIMVLDFVQIKNYNYEYKIYKILKDIYMWIGTYLFRKI
jgi:hypothetical protein